MNIKELANDLLPIFQAIAEGKEVQVGPRHGSGLWYPVREKRHLEELVGEISIGHPWRIKPEPVWRPWKPEEAPDVLAARSRTEHHAIKASVFCFNKKNEMYYKHGESWHTGITLEDMKTYFVCLQADESYAPCGVLEEAP